MPRLEEIAFDSERKLMSTKYRLHGVSTILTKGAVDVLLDRSVKLAESGGSREINDKIKEEILRQNQEFRKMASVCSRLRTKKWMRVKN